MRSCGCRVQTKPGTYCRSITGGRKSEPRIFAHLIQHDHRPVLARENMQPEIVKISRPIQMADARREGIAFVVIRSLGRGQKIEFAVHREMRGGVRTALNEARQPALPRRCAKLAQMAERRIELRNAGENTADVRNSWLRERKTVSKARNPPSVMVTPLYVQKFARGTAVNSCAGPRGGAFCASRTGAARSASFRASSSAARAALSRAAASLIAASLAFVASSSVLRVWI